MNRAIPSGTSLFDVLTMIIPGGLIILLICICLGGCIGQADGMMIFWYFVLSYLVGLVWNMFMDTFFYGFRNDTYSIRKAKDKQENKEENECFPTCLCRNMVDAVRMLCRVAIYWVLPECCSKKVFVQDAGFLKEYYEAYYKVATCSIGDVIIILETQVAFIRNMLLVVLGYAAYFILWSEGKVKLDGCPTFLKDNAACVGWMLLVFFIFLVFTMISRQQKIYFRIWEEAEYRR